MSNKVLKDANNQLINIDSSNLSSFDEGIVHTTGNEPISGIKTFDDDLYVSGSSTQGIHLYPEGIIDIQAQEDALLRIAPSSNNKWAFVNFTPNNGVYTYFLDPDHTGTIVTTNDLAGKVSRTGDETIDGVKEFYGSLITRGGPGGSYLGANDIGGVVFKGVSGLSNSATTLKAHTNGTSSETYSLLLPAKSDTLAVLGDIPHLYQHCIRYAVTGHEMTFVILNTTSTPINNLDLCKGHIGEFIGAHGFYKSSSGNECYTLEVTSINRTSYTISFTYGKVTTEATIDLTSVSPYPAITDTVRTIF